MYYQSSLSSFPSARSTTRKRITLHINPVRFLFALFFTLILFSFAAVISAIVGDSSVQGKVDVKIASHSVVVEAGDSLWSIAAANKGSQQDIRNYIEEIKSLNKLASSSLKHGQVLVLPE